MPTRNKSPDHYETGKKLWDAFFPEDKIPEYYVWRTQDDDKVRSSHAHRDGEIFSRDNPPPGGHPGEDYNCRCYPEAYTPANEEEQLYHKRKDTDRIDKLSKENKSQDLPTHLEFDGKKLSWIVDGKTVKSWEAMSGNPQYQSSQYTSTKDYGPMPEGKWHVKQARTQHYDDISYVDKTLSNLFGSGAWGKIDAWGKHRIWLDPVKTTDAKGRTNFTIHGGVSFGSQGCIDLKNNMDDFINTFLNYNKDIELIVKYPKDW